MVTLFSRVYMCKESCLYNVQQELNKHIIMLKETNKGYISSSVNVDTYKVLLKSVFKYPKKKKTAYIILHIQQYIYYTFILVMVT